MAEEQISGMPRLVEVFHRAALDGNWQGALHEASAVLGAEGIALIGMPAGQMGANHSEGVDELVERFVGEKWFLRNPRMEAAARRGLTLRSFSTEWTLFSDYERRMLPFNGELINPLGFGPFFGAYLGERDGNGIVLSVERKQHQGSYQKHEIERILAVMPSLQQATRIALRLADARDAGLGDGLDLMSSAAFLLDHAGRPVHANRRATGLLAVDLTIVGGRLTPRHPPSSDRFNRAVAEALAFPSAIARPTRLAIGRDGRCPLVADVAPLRGASDDLFRQAKAIVLIDDPEAPGWPDATVGSLVFGLTPTESAIAVRIAAGRSPEQCASDLGIGVGTVRVHLKAIFGKTGTHRQAGLAALYARFRRTE